MRRPRSLPPALAALGASLVVAAGETDDSDSGATASVTYASGGPPSAKTLITRINPFVEGFFRSLEKSYGSEVADDLDTDG